MNAMTATTMPEAIRQNRTNLETGHPPAGERLFGQWTRREQRRGSVQYVDGSWDGLDPARLDEGRVPAELMRRSGQQTGLSDDSAFTDA
jgi:hypothetical protein